jgi:ArsR family transcriptional regulator, arsenate/arsenite/antimonite-responsive transcriptional repressor
MTVSSGYRALADPTRREILRLLREGDLAAGELAGEFDISWPSVSRHLRVLETAGLVSSERRGGHIIYSLQTSVLQDVATEVAEMAGMGRQPSRRPSSARSPRQRPRPEQA